MSIVCQSEVGLFLDHLSVTQNWYKLKEDTNFKGHQQERIHTQCDPKKQERIHTQCDQKIASDDSVLGYSRASYDDNTKIKETEIILSKEFNGYRMKADLFAIESPFMMESQMERLMCQNSDGLTKTEETSADRKRRKKSMKTENASEDKNIFTHIKTALAGLIPQARALNYLSQVTTTYSKNYVAKAAARLHGCKDLFQLLCIETDEILGFDSVEFTVTSDLFLGGKRQCTAQSLIRTCVRNDDCRVIKVDNQYYLIPEKSSFLTSSFHYFTSIGYYQILVPEGYDLIVIDPPWENKSVKRKKSYTTLDEVDLKLLPIKTLSNEGCLICVWVTNNERMIKFVKEELFPLWSVEWKANWLWMKVTKSGVPVCEMTSPHKKPYEQLIIGKYYSTSGQIMKSSITLYNGQNNKNDSFKNLVENCETPEQCFMSISGKLLTSEDIEKPSAISENQCKVCTSLNSAAIEKERTSAMPEHIPHSFLIVTVPCSLHSKKPPLSEVFMSYLPKDPSCIELFARNLVPKWTSWGNEPLKHQHLDYYEEVLQ
ncbi:Methyltransferase-like protein 4 [Bulinus truncatus]|nr:Methyltransferase-like protein 4 [Bulinus truncatus]